jgi:hypothetical protein
LKHPDDVEACSFEAFLARMKAQDDATPAVVQAVWWPLCRMARQLKPCYWRGYLRRWLQRRIRGWDDSETWSLDHSFCTWIVPRLKVLRDNTHGYPCALESMAVWTAILNEMIDGFSVGADDDRAGSMDHHQSIFLSADTTQADLDRRKHNLDSYNRAMTLFAEHHRSLWN